MTLQRGYSDFSDEMLTSKYTYHIPHAVVCWNHMEVIKRNTTNKSKPFIIFNKKLYVEVDRL